MKKICCSIITFLWMTIAYSQPENDYKFINQVLPDLIGSHHLEGLKIYEKSIKFQNQLTFFSKEYLREYTYPVVGVDGKKVQKLIRTLDFGYLSKQIRDEDFWDLAKINLALSKYEADPNKPMDFVERFGIAKPIFSKDKKFAFVYYEHICGGPDCGSATVKIYKFKNGKWSYYTQIPIWIS